MPHYVEGRDELGFAIHCLRSGGFRLATVFDPEDPTGINPSRIEKPEDLS